MYVYVCVYIYIYIYIHVYTYIYVIWVNSKGGAVCTVNIGLHGLLLPQSWKRNGVHEGAILLEINTREPLYSQLLCITKAICAYHK